MLLGALLSTAYFAHHGVLGTHGLVAKDRLLSRSSDLEREIAVLEAMRRRLRDDVLALRPDPPRPDIVETVARSTLGLIRRGDLIVIRQRVADTGY